MLAVALVLLIGRMALYTPLVDLWFRASIHTRMFYVGRV